MLRSTFLAEGASDRALLPIVRWLLACHWPRGFADPQYCGSTVRALEVGIRRAVRDFPCDLLLVHRDADRVGYGQRVQELREAIVNAGISPTPAVCLVPVRETEAWLLIDERAIRRAAGHRDGRRSLSLPTLRELEAVSAPKERLYQALRTASELSGRRAQKFRVEAAVQRVAELIEDPSILRALPAFAAFEAELVAALARIELTPPAP